MRAIKIIFFDLDGTLADSRADITNAVNRARRALGVKGDKTLSEVHTYVGGGLEETVRRAFSDAQGGENGNKEHLLEKALVVFRDFYRENPVVGTTLYPAVRSTLEELAGTTKAVLTNKDHDIAVDVLERLSIRKHFTDIIGGNDELYRKPSPEGINKIIRKYGFDRSEALIAGDMVIDILTGKAAGIRTCGVTYGIGRPEDIRRAEPDFLIDSLSELINIVKP
jgi:2-phosphoglycolate phosphatase